MQEIDPFEKEIKFKRFSRMNSNNWLSFPLSPTHSSLPPHLQNAQSHHFSLGLVNETIDNPFQNQGILRYYSEQIFIPVLNVEVCDHLISTNSYLFFCRMELNEHTRKQ